MLKCLNDIICKGYFGVVGVTYEKINTETWLGDYENVDGLQNINNNNPAIYFSIGDELNHTELIITIVLVYDYFKLSAYDYLKVHPKDKVFIEEILSKYLN